MSSILSEAEAPPLAVPSPQSAGAWLRAARMAQGLHIAALAAQLKVPQAKLEALEADRYQDLPDLTFARALAKAMCRVLKVDAAPVLALLPRGDEAGLDRVSRGLNQPFRERPGREDTVSLDWLKRPLVWAPAGLLLAALAIYLLPPQWLGSLDALGGSEAEQAAIQPAEPAASTVAETPPLPPAELAPSAAVQPAVVQAAPPVASAAAPVVVPASAPVLAVGQVPLSIKTSAESWVEVVDTKGQVLFSKLMRPGESAALAAQPPLRLRVGNVSGTEITLRGAAVDLAAQAKDNVARLELN
ncbi:helix-turn-helix domain-containing protein [Paucibacter sp. O1-1]|nr:helix-turn-helix domain-containing protein [Paucibacter sp. O1-1]MDA3826466.1 helix-turn-helix domain-containing protein [Paucibacter sp. O1-1]